MLHTWWTSHNAIIWYYRNILTTLTNIQDLCALRTPFDIVVNALFSHGSHPKRSWLKYRFLQICSYNSGPRGSPDVILSACYVKFHREKNEIPPRACKPFRPFWPFRLSKSQKSSKINNFAKSPSSRADIYIYISILIFSYGPRGT